MVGRLKISPQAEAVRQLFMALEENAKRIKTCWFCASQLSRLKLANQGHLSGNHKPGCVFEELATAGEHCIIVRHHYCPAISRTESTGWNNRVDQIGSCCSE